MIAVRLGIAAALCGILSAAPVLAGDGNTIWLTQTSPTGSLSGNSLVADQGAASNSLISGVKNENLLSAEGQDLLRTFAGDYAAYDPNFALQRGELNNASLVITGNGGKLQLLQSSDPLTPFTPGSSIGQNTATATVGANGAGTVIQVGAGNTADLSLTGAGAQGLVSQFGNGLQSTLSVGAGGTGTVTQIGNGSTTGIVTVAPGTTLNLTQIGNNLQPVGVTSAQVISATNPGAISITQTAW